MRDDLKPKVTTVVDPGRAVQSVVIMLPGGRTHDRSSVPTPRLASIRMIPFTRALRRVTRGAPVAIWQLRYRYRGWNEPHRDPIDDLGWALALLRRRHRSASAILVGHSMGGRVALVGGGDPIVTGICGLSPWIEPGDPVVQLEGKRVLIAHGTRDRITDPAETHRYAERARPYARSIEWVPIPGETHTLLHHPFVANTLVTTFVTSFL